MSLPLNAIHNIDCLEGLQQMPEGSVDLVFADPPFNIGYSYDVYDDRRAAQEYEDWSEQWMRAVHRVLEPTGTFWLAIGDEFAAELKVLATKQVGFHLRSWVIWYYTFGVNCVRGFSRSHTHLFHFVKNASKFTFNAHNPAVRVKSARELVYGDRRANPKGRLPDNTWILRPQDAPQGFLPLHDIWYYARVAGTFKEREGFHGCQMPEQLLGRIIRTSSNPRDVVLDPFGGSGTTLAVAKKLGRRFTGFELSEDYVDRINVRLAEATVGGELDGPPDPVASAPATNSSKARRLDRGQRKRPLANNGAVCRRDAKRAAEDEEIRRGVIAAYGRTSAGLSPQCVLADPETDGEFLASCKSLDLPGRPWDWNRALFCLRRSSELAVPDDAKTLPSWREIDPFSHAAEIALQEMRVEYGASFEDTMCNPELTGVFDDIAAGWAQGYSPQQYRAAAFRIRQRVRRTRKACLENENRLSEVELPPLASQDRSLFPPADGPGVYVLEHPTYGTLYVGETHDLAGRLDQLETAETWKNIGPLDVRTIPDDDRPCVLQAHLVTRLRPWLNWRRLAMYNRSGRRRRVEKTQFAAEGMKRSHR